MTQEQLFLWLTIIGLISLLVIRIRRDFKIFLPDYIINHGKMTITETGKRSWKVTILWIFEINYTEK